MDRRTVLAVALSLAIWYTWMALFGPPVNPEEPGATDAPVPEAGAPAQPIAGATAAPVTGPSRQVAVDVCGLDGVLDTDVGGLRNAVLPEYDGPYEVTPLYQWVLGLFGGNVGPWRPYGEVLPREQVLGPDAMGLTPGIGNPAATSARFEVARETADEVVLRGVAANGVELTSTWSRNGHGSPCAFDVTVTWRNTGGTAISDPLWVGMFDALDPPGGMFSYYTNTEQAFVHVEDDLEYGYWTEPSAGAAHVPEQVGDASVDWFALSDRYFGVFAIPQNSAGTASWSLIQRNGVTLRGLAWSPKTGLNPGESHSETLTVHAGPHDTDALALVAPSLPEIVDFGMFAVFAYPLLALLRFLHGFVGNWGVAIMLLTVLVRAAFFPLNQSAMKSSEAMKAIQPEMNRIREEFKDNAEELNRRTMELWREHGVNPAGGCLPMLIQMPVFLALFYVLMYSIELYHTQFLYLKDLSSPDPYMVLPAIVVALMMVQQQFVPMENMDPAQARMMKLMPLLFGFFWFLFPSGLVVYYFVNTALGILQQWWIRRTFPSASPGPAAAPGT